MFTVYQIIIDEMTYRQIDVLGHKEASDRFPAYGTAQALRRGSARYTHDMRVHFTKVAEIDADNLNEVFEIGNGYGDQSKLNRLSKMHSVSVGDLIVDSKGDWYMVEPMGWSLVHNSIGYFYLPLEEVTA